MHHHRILLRASLFAFCATGLFCSIAAAQETSPPELAPPETVPEPLPRSTAQRAAQDKVSEARKLAKIQRYKEASALVEEAFLVLEDPELIRMLGEWSLAMKSYESSVRYFDTYLADPTVGESAKELVRLKRLKALAESGDKEAQAKLNGIARDGGQEQQYDDLIDGWQFHDAGTNTAGGFYLTLGGHLTHNEGADFTAPQGGEGPEAELVNAFSWVHGGLGIKLEFGGYLTEHYGLGLSVSNDWMSWEHRAPSVIFQTTLYSGIRPELAINNRYFFDSGFFLGGTIGADMIILTEGADLQEICAKQGGDCSNIGGLVIETGLQGWRGFLGPIVGYRSEVVSSLTIGLAFDLKYYPLFSPSDDLVEELPAFTDNSWMINASVLMNWNL